MIPQFSIIIPVYNTPVEKIERCINSVCKQSFSNFEVIVVDDGSEKQYAVLLDDIVKVDSRIRIIHKNNEGSSIARNVGIVNAKGSYIGFVDSDDILLPMALQESNDVIIQYEPDIVLGFIQHYIDNGTPINRKIDNNNPKVYCFDSKEEINLFTNHILGYNSSKFIIDDGNIADSPCARFCRSDIVKETLFTAEGYCDDDTVWNLSLFPKCKSFAVVYNVWYLYMLNVFSKTRRFRDNSLYELSFRCKQEYDLVEKNFPDCKNGVYIRIWRLTAVLGRSFLFHTANKMSFHKKYAVFKEFVQAPVYQTMLKNIAFNSENNYLRNILKRSNRFFSLHGPLVFSYLMWMFFVKRNV